MGAVDLDAHRRIPRGLDAVICKDGSRFLGPAPNPPRCWEPIPDLGPGIYESGSYSWCPVPVGFFRARILLPRDWRSWDAVKLRAVLAHERAHIRRGDWLVRVASHVNVCIFWFHPLAWWLERELARLAEEACDDVALSGLNREEYAATLVDIARAAAAGSRVLKLASYFDGKGIPNVLRRPANRILSQRVQVATNRSDASAQ